MIHNQLELYLHGLEAILLIEYQDLLRNGLKILNCILVEHVKINIFLFIFFIYILFIRQCLMDGY